MTLDDVLDRMKAVWESEVGLTQSERLQRNLARSKILDAIKMRVRTMEPENIHKAYEEVQKLVKLVAPHWYVYNAIVKEMDQGYVRGDTIERIVSQAMRRMQDGLLFNRWLGQK